MLFLLGLLADCVSEIIAVHNNPTISPLMCQFAIPGKKNPLQLRSICAVLALTLALALSIAQVSSAQQLSLTVAWNPGTGPIAGYMVYYGEATGQYTNSVNAGNNLSATLPNLSN
ncbi:MAG: fibronectin type III domain-containing protein, partial [Syntrophobacteraceae bacterium]